MSRSVMTGRQMDKTDYFTTCACARGNEFQANKIYRCWYWELWSHDLPSTYPQYLCSKVNKGREYRMHYIPRVVCIGRGTWLPTLRTWLTQVDFSQRHFCDSCKIYECSFCIAIHQHFQSKSCSCCLHSRPRLQWAIWMNEWRALIGQFLKFGLGLGLHFWCMHDFPKAYGVRI